MLVLATDSVVAAQRIERGIAHFKQNQFERAIAEFDAALQLVPDDLYARWNRAGALLSLGDYARGFKEHDVAWRLFHWRGFSQIGDVDRLAHLPLWRGERDARVLAYHELGYGDAIMAMRYLPEIRRRASEVVLVVDRPLARLAMSFDVVVATQLPLDLCDFDFCLPFFGVMSALGETEATIPNAPYIARDFPTRGSLGTKVGIVWSGRTQNSFTLQRFLSLLDHDGFQLHALQPGPVADHRVESLRAGADFADVADRIAAMDHIVSVDTAAIHLAGAMGHPSAHLLLPYLSDWRWHRTELWYPTLKTYRQPSADDDWSAPFARLNKVLHVDGVRDRKHGDDRGADQGGRTVQD